MLRRVAFRSAFKACAQINRFMSTAPGRKSKRPVVVQTENDYVEDPELLIGKRLLLPGKSNYRHLENLPSWLEEKRKQIFKLRTSNQKKLTLQTLLEKIPSFNYDIQREYRDRKIGWSTLKSTAVSSIAYGPSEVVVYVEHLLSSNFLTTLRVLKDLQLIQPNFKPRRVLDFGCGPATAFAAVIEVWGDKSSPSGMRKYTGVDHSQPMLDAAKILTQDRDVDCVFWNKTAEVLNLAKTRGDRFDLIVASFTLSEMPNDVMRSASVQLLVELLAADGHIVFLEAGGPQGSHTIRTARQFALDSFNVIADRGKAKRVYAPEPSPVTQQDIVVGSNFVKSGIPDSGPNNIKPDDGRVTFVLPPPAIEGFGNLIHKDFGVSVVAPCTHDKPCPLGPGVWCSFSQKVGVVLNDNDRDAKFSYVILQRTIVKKKAQKAASAVYWLNNGSNQQSGALSSDVHSPTPLTVLKRFEELESQVDEYNRQHSMSTPISNGPPDVSAEIIDREEEEEDEDGSSLVRVKAPKHPLLQGLIDNLLQEVDWESYDPPLYRSEWSRVLRSPLKGRGHVTLDLCHPSGSVTRHVISKAQVYPVPSFYTALRRVGWGGLFPALNGKIGQEDKTKIQPTGSVPLEVVSKKKKKKLQKEKEKSMAQFGEIKFGTVSLSALSVEASGSRKNRMKAIAKEEEKSGVSGKDGDEGLLNDEQTTVHDVDMLSLKSVNMKKELAEFLKNGADFGDDDEEEAPVRGRVTRPMPVRRRKPRPDSVQDAEIVSSENQDAITESGQRDSGSGSSSGSGSDNNNNSSSSIDAPADRPVAVAGRRGRGAASTSALEAHRRRRQSKAAESDTAPDHESS